VKAIIVGARGGVRELLQRLSERWQVTLIDPDPALLARAAAVRTFEEIVGDGSSRVILGRAGIESADAVVAATGDDDVNLEVCRIAIEAGVMRVTAIGADSARLAEYRAMGITAFVPDTLTARGLETVLEPRRIASATFAGGRAEAIEFRIADDSPLQGMAVRDLHSESYLVAAVLREGSLIVPHGSTVFESGDLVTVVGSTAEFPRIVATFTSGAPRFPLDFGKSVLAVVPTPGALEAVVAEAVDLTRNSAAESLLVLCREDASATPSEDPDRSAARELVRHLAAGLDVTFMATSGDPVRRVPDVIAQDSVGLVVLPAPLRGRFALRRVSRLLRRTRSWGRPVLLARGTHPHRRVVVPVRDTPAALAASRAAIDLAADGRATLTGVAVVSPAFVTGSDDREVARRALARVREEGAMLEAPVRRILREGNPVRQLAEVAEDADLLVVGWPARGGTPLAPGMAAHLVARIGCSVLVVPQL
jgi:Trk K+ transport system NAD-binding subunit/nucleotide-binding universal stress UspA family protein